MNKYVIIFLIFFMLVSVPPSSGESKRVEPSQTGVTQTLISLLEKQDRTVFSAEDYESTSLGDLITFGTPAGYRLKLRYLKFGMSLVEALKVSRDKDMKKRLIEMVQWSRTPEVRAEAILTLAGFFDPAHKKYFKEALLDSKIGIRFAAVEALQVWNQEGTIPLLRLAKERDWSPFMQVHAAQALLSLGEDDAVDVLWELVEHDSSLVRAMAARYLGDYGDPRDYEKIVGALRREKKNDFVIAELSIAALKLISQKGDQVSYSPFRKGWNDNDEVKYHIVNDNVVQLEPLIIVPPRLRIPESLRIASQINSELLRLIKDRLDAQLDPIQAQDPVLQDLYGLVTPSGFGLKTRYSELSYLVIEGLAGSNDALIRSELERLARSSTNPLIRATALISLAYSRREADYNFILDAIGHDNPIVRIGAMEAIEVGRFVRGLPEINNIASGDPSPALQVYAMHLLAKFGQDSGRNYLLGQLGEPDWPARAMAFWYMGRYGHESDYNLILSKLPYENNPFVQTEIALAALRLQPLD